MAKRADAQKDSMKVIDGLVENVRGNPFERRYFQNVRILREFPWLWAIRQVWELSTDVILVMHYDESLLKGIVWLEDAVRYPHRVEALWIHGTMRINGRPIELVRQAWGNQHGMWIFDSDDDDTWVDLIIYEGRDFLMTHVVMVTADDHAVTVLRPPRCFDSFNAMWAI